MASVMLVDWTESPPKYYCVPCAEKSGAMEEDDLEHSSEVDNVVCCVCCGLRIVDLPSPPLNRYDVVVCLHFTEVVASNLIEAVALVVEPIEAQQKFEVTSANVVDVDD